MSTVVQPCARCGARWAVQGRPMHWCPRCQGVLLSPAPVDAPPERRNYRWVARPPGHRPHERPAVGRPRSPETPRYTEIPRWGLRDAPPADAVPARRSRFDVLTDNVTGLLWVTAAIFLVAALAELGRYLILLRNRTRLIPPALLAVSDWVLYLAAALSLVFALGAAVAAAGWLIRARRAAYEQAGQRDPRPAWMLLCGCVIPGVNLVWPGLFLTEPARRRGDLRALRAVRIWWGAWAVNGVMVVAALCWHAATTLQAQANGVIFTFWTDLAAAAVTVLTLWTMRVLEGRDLRGRFLATKRWVPAPGPANPVIEPVHPAAAAEPAPDTAAGDDAAGNDASDSAVGNDGGTVVSAVGDGDRTDAAHEPAPASQPAQEEVIAK